MIKEFSKRVNVSVADLKSKKRTKDIALARQMYFKLLRTKTEYSLEAIALECDRVNHATVIHGLKKIDNLIEAGDNKAVEMWNKVKDIKTDEEKRRLRAFRNSRNL